MFVSLLLLLFGIFLRPTHATDEFRLEQNITYTINRSGSAIVHQENKLVNNLSQIYAKEYFIQLSGANILNVSGTDQNGNIVQSVEHDGEQTTISLKFNNPAVGKDQHTSFRLNYQSPDFAINKGKIWEITLPEFKGQNESDIISISLKVPTSFGKVSYSSIPLGSANQIGNEHIIQINGNSLKNKRILLVFGDFQLFDFDLTYYLDNDSSDYISTRIAIPPDTETQKLFYSSIEPRPVTVIQDNDGNWLSEYHLDPHQSIEVQVSGQVKIYPRNSKSQIADTSKLISDQEYWPVSHPQIQKITNNLTTPKSVYDYVVKTLNYDYDRINSAQRKGALLALENPSNSLCTEFTDLFVTLTRAISVPAREVQGFAYTNNPKVKPTNINADILHAWPQYYDNNSQKWISIDPTWAKTTNGIDYFNDLDLNHFAFVIHGENSQYPSPPGSYKHDRQIKTVDVRFAQKEIDTPEAEFPTITSDNPALNQNPSIIIQNENLFALSNIRIVGDSFSFDHTIDSLPPLGKLEIDIPQISFLKSLLPKNQNIKLSVSIENGQSHSIAIPYMPHFLNLALTILGLLFLSSTTAIILISKKKK